jgi:hypothetical protein
MKKRKTTKPLVPKKRRKVGRSGKTGEFVTPQFVASHPATTVTEIYPVTASDIPVAALLEHADEVLADENIPVEVRLNWAQRCFKAIRHFVVG